MNLFQRFLSNKYEGPDADQDDIDSQASFSAAVMKIEAFTSRNQAGKQQFELRWLEPHENPFMERVFDCREYAFNRIATTKNAAIANLFRESRDSNGIEFLGQFPDNAAKLEVNYNFHSKAHPAYREGIPDGVLFKAKTMEEKWDIYKHSNFLFFVRSWTGELVYFSTYIATKVGFKTDVIVFDNSRIEKADPFFELKVVEFLIYSHILGLQVPHPIPKMLQDDPATIAGYSFSMFGSKGCFATY